MKRSNSSSPGPRCSSSSVFGIFDRQARRKGKKKQYRQSDRKDNVVDVSWRDLPIGAEHIVKQIAAEQILEELLDKINDRDSVQHDVIRNVVAEFPATCQRSYQVIWEDGTVRQMLPLWIICCLCPPISTVKAVYEAYPEAVLIHEPCKNSLSLHLAAAFEASLEVIQFIYSKHEAAVKSPRNDGVLPIMLALSYYVGDPAVVNFLIDQYPESASKVCNGIQWSPLHSAAHGGVSDINILRRLHEQDHSMIHSADKHGRIPIHLACLSKRGNPELVQFLMKTAPETATVEDNLFGRTPIHLLCINQAPETIRVMLDMLPNQGDTANTYGGASILAWAAMKNSPESVDYLARRFPYMLSVPTMDEAHYTPLYCAIYNDAPIETMRILIEHYPQALFTLDGSGRRPLRAARSSGVSKDIIHLLESSERKHRNLLGGWFCF